MDGVPEDEPTGSLPIKVFLLVGGLGKRLRSLVNDVPKPMAPIHGQPFLEYQLHLLSRYGLRHFVLCAGYMASKIIEYFGDGSRWGYTVEYSVEKTLMGTGGALQLASRFIDADAPFLVMNGDTYFDVDYRAIVAYHQQMQEQRGSFIGTLVLTHSTDKSRYGSVAIDEESKRILSFAEKAQDSNSSLISAGIYVLEPEILRYIPNDRPVSIERDVFPSLCSSSALYGMPVEGLFVDIGTPEGYLYLSQNLAPLLTAKDR